MKDVFEKFMALVAAIFSSLGRFIMMFTRYLIPLFLKFLIVHREHLMSYLRKQAKETPEKWDDLYTEAIGKLLDFLEVKRETDKGKMVAAAKAKMQTMKDIEFRNTLIRKFKADEPKPDSE